MQHLLSNESHVLTRGDLEKLGDMTEGKFMGIIPI